MADTTAGRAWRFPQAPVQAARQSLRPRPAPAPLASVLNKTRSTTSKPYVVDARRRAPAAGNARAQSINLALRQCAFGVPDAAPSSAKSLSDCGRRHLALRLALVEQLRDLIGVELWCVARRLRRLIVSLRRILRGVFLQRSAIWSGRIAAVSACRAFRRFRRRLKLGFKVGLSVRFWLGLRLSFARKPVSPQAS